MQFLRLNSGTGGGSGVTISVGPALDSTGAEYTGLAIGDLTLTKNGVSASMASAATLTATSNGHYDLVTIGNNADTLGRLRIRCNKSGYQIPPLEFMVIPAKIYDSLVAGSDTLGESRTLYVSTTGNDGNSGLTRSLAFATWAAAISAANPGDTIRILAGTYTEQVSNTKHRLTFEGDSDNASTGTILTYSGDDYTFLNSGNSVKMRCLRVNNTSTNSTLNTLNIPVKNTGDDFIAEEATASGHSDGFWSTGSRCVFHLCSGIGHWDAFNIQGRGSLIDSCRASTDGSYDVTTQAHAIIAVGSTIINTRAQGTRTNAATGPTIGLGITDCTVIGGSVSMNLQNAGASGDVAAIGHDLLTARLSGVRISTTNSGSGGTYDVDASVSGSAAVLEACLFDSTKVSGAANIQVINGGVDLALVRNPTASNALTGTTLSPSQVVASVTAPVTASGGTVSAFLVDKDHTWEFNSPSQITSPNILSELIGFAGLLAMDFTSPMPAHASISSITSAAFANDAGTEPTVTSSAMSTDKKSANVLIDASAATAGTYTLSVKIVTTDSQTFVRKGRITIA